MSGSPLPGERISVIGLGYVGLPLVLALAKASFRVIAYDRDAARIDELRRGYDRSGECTLCAATRDRLRFTARPQDLAEASFHIIAVPTPIDANRCPDLSALRAACMTVGEHLRPGSVVVLESTVYPGATEEICVPELEAASGLIRGQDFVVGYSPERINPGDAAHGLAEVTKVIAGEDPATLERIAAVYARIVAAGLHRAPSIAVAEMAKLIENTQRDLNIALMNEVAKICHLLDLRTSDVLAAAETKWNFVRFRPGLVGGHCIGVDPYYLTAKAQQAGYHPEVILGGRRINSGMGAYVAHETIRLMAAEGITLPGARVGILGLTFKENVRDLRNSAVCDLLRALAGFGLDVLIHDPIADDAGIRAIFGSEPSALEDFSKLDALILAVPHTAYDAISPARISTMLNDRAVFVDIRDRLGGRLIRPGIRRWSL